MTYYPSLHMSFSRADAQILFSVSIFWFVTSSLKLLNIQTEFADEAVMLGEEGFVLATVQTAVEYLIVTETHTL